MDEKTESLRNIFMEVAEGETVTERQEESPGTLTGERPLEDRLTEVIDEMRDAYSFTTEESNEDLLAIAQYFYDDQEDETIADECGLSPSIVFAARLDLHLIRDEDTEGPISQKRLRNALEEKESAQTVADEFGCDTATVQRQLAVEKTKREMRQENYRFRDRFDELLGDADVAEHMPDDVTEDGLKEATEGLEVETGF